MAPPLLPGTTGYTQLLESVYSASVRPIPLNVMTLYADLAQRLALQDTRPGSISSKKVDGRKYLYAVEKDGRTRTQRFLGPATSSVAQAEAARIRRAAELAKELRNTVTLLKNAHVPAPSLGLGRILEVVANAGLFQRGVTLVGTAAYQTYACVVGSHLAAANLTTNDVDLSLSEFVAGDREEEMQTILKRADPTFEPVLHADDRLPKVFMAANGFTVDFVTRRRRGRRSPAPVDSLGVSAVALSFQELPVEDTMESVALYGSGVLVRVPSPLKFAVHKLIVAQQRRQAQTAKKQKDLSQAQELIDIYLETDEGALLDALDDARERGRAWKSAINASLREIGREAGQGRVPVATSSRKRT